MSDFIEGFHKPFGVIAPAPTASVDIGGGGPHIEIETSVTETTKSPWSK